MDSWHIVILAFIQGLTEFLPISSSAHLILLPELLAWESQGLAFDVALHVGSLVAILLYFRGELGKLITNWLLSLKIKQATPESQLVWNIGLGTIPAVIIGGLLSSFNLEEQLRIPEIIIVTTFLFSLLLLWADLTGKRERDEFSLSWREVLLIGVAQTIALIPGTSRSGVTMTVALFLGVKRKSAARFSFLLAIPIIILAGSHETLLILRQSIPAIEWSILLWGAMLSAVFSYLCIYIFIALLERIGMLPFVIYRLLLGMFISTMVLTGNL